jgi:hypothetical protein
MTNNQRHNKANSIGEVLKIVLDENKLSNGLNNVKINELWKEIMGQGVVSYTEKIQLQGDTLIVHLKSSVLREELSYGKEKMIKMFNEAMGEELIKKIKLI